MGQPQKMVTCSDGEKSLVRIEVNRTRWFCPDIGDVKDEETSRFIRTDARQDQCVEYSSQGRVVLFTE